jgi:hypothetical protein
MRRRKIVRLTSGAPAVHKYNAGEKLYLYFNVAGIYNIVSGRAGGTAAMAPAGFKHSAAIS